MSAAAAAMDAWAAGLLEQAERKVGDRAELDRLRELVADASVHRYDRDRRVEMRRALMRLLRSVHDVGVGSD